MTRPLLIITFAVLLLISYVHSTPNIVSRSEWGARKPKALNPLQVNPPTHVVVHHTATRGCDDIEKCKVLVKSFQTYHMDEKGWDDIAYNFLIGEDGRVFEGRGWGVAGSHAKSYNNKSVGIALIGTFTDQLPNDLAMKTLEDLLAFAVTTENIANDYKLIGHRQAQSTECPGRSLYDKIKSWPHWSDEGRH